MPTYFEPVIIPERCLLREVLYWLSFQRLPVYETDNEGVDIRESREAAEYVIEVGASFLYPEECKRANIPVDPNYVAVTEERPSLDPSYYRKLMDEYQEVEPSFRLALESDWQEAVALEQQRARWKVDYLGAVEYPASRIFVALRSGQLRGEGRLLPTFDIQEATALGASGDIFDIEFSEIPADFWSLQNIDFETSAARGGASHYCHISFRTEEVLALFPGEREAVDNVQRVGSTLVIADGSKSLPRGIRRGRPSYPWEPFYVEVARLLRDNSLPAKKEAAIQYFQSWFPKELAVSPSRAAIGEKLTPYYEKLVRSGRQKI